MERSKSAALASHYQSYFPIAPTCLSRPAHPYVVALIINSNDVGGDSSGNSGRSPFPVLAHLNASEFSRRMNEKQQAQVIHFVELARDSGEPVVPLHFTRDSIIIDRIREFLGFMRVRGAPQSSRMANSCHLWIGNVKVGQWDKVNYLSLRSAFS